MKAPFPWFGGKSKVAPQVWQALGDVDNYVEPFAGSLAALLERPDWHAGATETVNDKDEYVANFWRALANDPDSVAKYADWPVNEADLLSRHIWLVNTGKALMQVGMVADPDWYDAKIAGWWLWGICSWIGGGWCSGTGLWTVQDGELVNRTGRGVKRQLPHLGNAGRGVNRQLPHLGNAGQGVNRQLPHLGDAGRGVNRKLPHLGDAGRGVKRQLPHLGDAGQGVNRQRQDIYAYMNQLADRLRRVRVVCGDWSRVVTDGAMSYGARVGVFLDPPYSAEVGRDNTLYTVEDLTVAHEVREWALANGDNPRLRIVLCGYEGEHDMPSTWRCEAWKANGGYAVNGSNENRHRERLWYSPHCLRQQAPTLFEVTP